MKYLILLALSLALVACDNPEAYETKRAPCAVNPDTCGPEYTQGGTR